MRVFKCDRCGKYFDKTSKNKEGGTDGLFLSRANCLTGEWFDICDECYASLEQWWNMKKAGGSNES